jgi:hypothetical protein
MHNVAPRIHLGVRDIDMLVSQTVTQIDSILHHSIQPMVMYMRMAWS